MKALLLSTALVAGLATVVLAQDSAATGPFRAESDPMAVRASEFIGARVYATDAAIDATEYSGVQDGWQDIGEVNDVILSRDGSVEAVLVDIGGFLGMGERQVAVEMSAVRFAADTSTQNDANDWFLVMTADRPTLEGAPAYMMGDSAAATDTTTATGGISDTGPTATAAATDGTAARTPVARDGYSTVAATDLTSEMLTGASVYDPQDANVGRVSDLIIAADGQITEVIVDVGGFLGMGTKPVALKMDQIDILRETDGNEVRVFVPATKAELEAMPDATM